VLRCGLLFSGVASVFIPSPSIIDSLNNQASD
jgi:hypothetical protein